MSRDFDGGTLDQVVDQLKGRPIGRWMGIAAVSAFAAFTALGSYYTVEPTEMAGVRRFGTVITPEPVGPGPHLKMPWIDTVDTLQVSLQTASQDDLPVHTIDNQKVDLGVRVVYTVPPSAVLPLLYTVGKAGTADIQTQVEGLVADRTGKIFAQQNTSNISNDRQKISDEIDAVVSRDLKKLYGLDVKDFQIKSIGYGEAFNDNITRMTKSKTDALAAQNKEQQIRAEGEQRKISADADAYSTRIGADAGLYQTEKQADSHAYTIKAEGTAEAESIKARRGSFATDQGFNDYLRATRYSGAVPTTVVLGGGNSNGLIPTRLECDSDRGFPSGCISDSMSRCDVEAGGFPWAVRSGLRAMI